MYYAITFDMSVAKIKQHYKKNIQKAYSDIGISLAKHGFSWQQGSVYCTTSGMDDVIETVMDLKNIAWFCKSVKDIQVFRIEEGANLTKLITANK